MLLQKEARMEGCKKKLKGFYANKLGKVTDLRMVGNAIKAFIGDYFIQYNCELRTREAILDEIKRQEEELKKFPEKISVSWQIKPLQKQLPMLIVREIEINMNYVKQKKRVCK